MVLHLAGHAEADPSAGHADAGFVRHPLDAPTPSWLRLSPADAGRTVVDYPPDRPPRLLAVTGTGHLVPPS